MSVIEILQFEEPDGGSRLQSWYAEGHHGPDDFARALVEFILDEGYDDAIPRIQLAEIRQCYMGKSDNYDGSWEAYFREDPLTGYEAVTVFDDEKRRSLRSCPIRGCKAVPNGHNPLSVIVDDTDQNDRLIFDATLCSEHIKQLPQPSYRAAFIPIGAVIQLPKEQDE